MTTTDIAMSPIGFFQTYSSFPEHDRFIFESRHRKLDIRFGADSVRLTSNRRRFRWGRKESPCDAYATCRERNGGSEKPPLMADRHHSVVTNWKSTKSLSDIF
jgi:hypothetical protein